ncbi:hypothetical protein BIW11_07069 [Tropilaelaps mercedesae]|uniref:Chitin-binding type-2 domain-containing protein n=1 Tax=Tropilaelaps mercedesae TaxID=418985 RepID=A0A1V9XVM2_9ACAR|nr:hypothetical protein BIW11_07069 [Tropilaelaps mercedesae]
MLAHLVTIATCLLTRATAVPAFAGGLSNPVVPASASTFNLGPEPRNDTAFEPSDNDCPATDGTIPLYLPDPDSCTKYTVCSGAFGQKMECPPGMHFSASTSSCTFPALANCPLLENVGLTGLPAFGNPAEGIGQLPDKTPKDSLSSR